MRRPPLGDSQVLGAPLHDSRALLHYPSLFWATKDHQREEDDDYQDEVA